MRRIFIISLVMVWAAHDVAQPEPSPKPKVISLDYCSDQYVLALADKDQIIALSAESRNSHSFYRERAKDIPQGRAELEDIVTKTPDVVVRHWAGEARVVQYLKDSGIDVISARFGYSLPETIQNIEEISKNLGQIERGRNFISTLKSRMSAIENEVQKPLSALYVTPGGVTTGTGTLVDFILKKSGLINHAEKMGMVGWQTLPLEKLTIQKPDIIIAGFYDHASTGVDNWTFARHDFLRKMLQDTPTIHLSGSLLSCNGLFLPDAIEEIIESPILKDFKDDQNGLVKSMGEGR